jgi:hypothetical protein
MLTGKSEFELNLKPWARQLNSTAYVYNAFRCSKFYNLKLLSYDLFIFTISLQSSQIIYEGLRYICTQFQTNMRKWQAHKMPLVRYWKPSYSFVLSEWMLDSTKLSTNNWSCSSVRFKWKRFFRPCTVAAPDLKHGSCDPEITCHNKQFLLLSVMSRTHHFNFLHKTVCKYTTKNLFNLVRFQVLVATSMKMTAFCDKALCSLVQVHWHFGGVYCLIALLMEAVHTSEMSVYFYETAWCHIPEGSHFPFYLLPLFFIRTIREAVSSCYCVCMYPFQHSTSPLKTFQPWWEK